MFSANGFYRTLAAYTIARLLTGCAGEPEIDPSKIDDMHDYLTRERAALIARTDSAHGANAALRDSLEQMAELLVAVRAGKDSLETAMQRYTSNKPIIVSVVDENGNPFEGAEVNDDFSDSWCVVNQDGTYYLNASPPYDVVGGDVRAEGYKPVHFRVGGLRAATGTQHVKVTLRPENAESK
ncbi:MAG: carboxypeptidase-like regulatory domain-containing protein [archaeon]